MIECFAFMMISCIGIQPEDFDMKTFADEYIIWESGEGDYLSSHFHAEEFEDDVSKVTWLAIELVERLEAMRQELGFPLRITSGYRSEKKQQELKDKGYKTAKGISQHQVGRAADIDMSKLSSAQKKKLKDCATKYFRAIGIAHNFIHVDLREDKDRVWRY